MSGLNTNYLNGQDNFLNSQRGSISILNNQDNRISSFSRNMDESPEGYLSIALTAEVLHRENLRRIENLRRESKIHHIVQEYQKKLNDNTISDLPINQRRNARMVRRRVLEQENQRFIQSHRRLQDDNEFYDTNTWNNIYREKRDLENLIRIKLAYLERQNRIEYDITLEERQVLNNILSNSIYLQPDERLQDLDELDAVLQESLNTSCTLIKKNIKLLLNDTPYDESIHGENVCSICQSELVNRENVFIVPCTHIFHKSCLSTWGEYKPECPNCKYKIPHSIHV
jgi:hypothetical protein